MEFTAEGGYFIVEFGAAEEWSVHVPWGIAHERFEIEMGRAPTSKDELGVWMADRKSHYQEMIADRINGKIDRPSPDDQRVTAKRIGA